MLKHTWEIWHSQIPEFLGCFCMIADDPGMNNAVIVFALLSTPVVKKTTTIAFHERQSITRVQLPSTGCAVNLYWH
jgi:hypothetical protein